MVKKKQQEDNSTVTAARIGAGATVTAAKIGAGATIVVAIISALVIWLQRQPPEIAPPTVAETFVVTPSNTLLSQVPNAPPFLSLLDLIAEGDASMTEKHYGEAMDYYQRALNIDPRDSVILRKTGEAYIGLAMNETDFRYVIAHSLDAEVDFFNQALPYFDKAIIINPQDKDAYIFRGIVWYRLGNLHPMFGPSNNDQNAFSQFSYALQIELNTPNIPPEVWDHQSACAYYGIAKVYERMNTDEKYGGGINQYKKQVEEYMEKGDGC